MLGLKYIALKRPVLGQQADVTMRREWSFGGPYFRHSAFQGQVLSASP